jgi:hypothetical protein
MEIAIILLVWWIILSTISVLNIVVWIYLVGLIRRTADRSAVMMAWLSGAYVFVCAFRSFLPRIDVERIVLVNSWFSNVFLGRSLATIAELCFIIQWFIFLRYVLAEAGFSKLRKWMGLVVGLIAVAEVFSWYAVLNGNYWGSMVEETLWMISFAIIGMILSWVSLNLTGITSYIGKISLVGVVGYLAFMIFFDIPSYFIRSQTTATIPYHGLLSNLLLVASTRMVSLDIGHWSYEMIWMSLYFTIAVWASLIILYLFMRRDGWRPFLRADLIQIQPRVQDDRLM